METAKESIQKICEAIKEQTLIPARQKAEEIRDNAELEAKRLLETAKKQQSFLQKQQEEEAQKTKTNLEVALKLAANQAIDALKEEIEKKLISSALQSLLQKEMKKPEVIAKLLLALTEAMKQQGMGADFSLVLPEAFSKDALIKELSSEMKKILLSSSVEIGSFNGGIMLKLKEERITIDLTDEAVKELLMEYMREDFRRVIFGL